MVNHQLPEREKVKTVLGIDKLQWSCEPAHTDSAAGYQADDGGPDKRQRDSCEL